MKNELKLLALNQGLQWKRKLWTTRGWEQLQALNLEPWASQRRGDLLQLLAMLEGQIELLSQAVAGVAETYPSVF